MTARKISVVMATRNRGSALRTTLEAMAQLRPAPVQVEFVVVDNGSVDDTARVLRDAKRSLPIRALWASTPGKSHALNAALECGELGEIVVFTDDDVTPDEDWVEAICAACKRWPKHSVFGGRVNPAWPEGQLPPSWAHQDFIQSFAFARHVVCDVECEYPQHMTPFGPNFWLRREALAGMRFASALGPRPSRRMLGGETEFLLRLRSRGFNPVHAPDVRVEHRIEAARLSKLAVYRRALQLGSGMVYTRWKPTADTKERATLSWRLQRVQCVAKTALRLPLAAASFNESRRVAALLHELMTLGHEIELLRCPPDTVTGAS